MRESIFRFLFFRLRVDTQRGRAMGKKRRTHDLTGPYLSARARHHPVRGLGGNSDPREAAALPSLPDSGQGYTLKQKMVCPPPERKARSKNHQRFTRFEKDRS